MLCHGLMARPYRSVYAKPWGAMSDEAQRTMPRRGRYLVANEDLEEGRVVLISEAYLSMILNSHKKRVCSFCHQDCRRRLSLCCGGCHQVFWCSPECRAAHTAAELQAALSGRSSGLGADANGSDNEAKKGSRIASGGGAGLMPSMPVELGGATAERLCPLDPEGTGEASSSTSSTGCMEQGNSSSSSSSGSKHSGIDGCCEGTQPNRMPPRFQAGVDSSHGPSTPAARPENPWQRAPLSATAVPHSLVCGVLRQFGSVKWSVDVESVLLGVLQLLALELLEEAQAAQQGRRGKDGQGSLQHPQSPALTQHSTARSSLISEQPVRGSSQAVQQQPQQQMRNGSQARPGLPSINLQPSQAAASNSELPRLTHADFLMLQSHAADWDGADRRDWLKYAAQLIAMLNKAGWPGRLPSPELVLDYAGRITSNNFGIYSPPAALQAQQVQQGTEEVLGAGTEAGEQQGSSQAVPDGVALHIGQASAAVVQPAVAQCSGAMVAAAGQGKPKQQALGRAAAGQQLQEKQEPRPATKAELIGRELYITASFFNHSCKPNCVVQRGFKAATVCTQHAIKAGEELTISYMDIDLPRSARRNHLQKFFHFTCDCGRCEREAAEGSARCSYESSKVKTRAPKRRGRKARVSR